MNDRIAPPSRRGGQRVPTLLVLLLTSGLAACEFPTELPKWDTTWVVPTENTTIGVARLLPATITTNANGTGFVLSLPPATIARTLGEMCGAGCTALNGLTVPKPAFSASFGTSIALPGDVVSAQVTGGTLQVSLTHDLSFDPIRPSALTRGYLVLTASAGTTVLAKDSIAGEATAFAPGSTLNRTLTLAAANVTGPISVSVAVSSPAGDPVTIDTSDSIRLTATPTAIQVSQAQIRVSNRTIDAAEVELDLGDIDETVTDNTKAGALLLTLTNPFAVSGNLTLTITAPGTTINKTVALAQGTTTTRVEFDQQEIRAILGASPVRLRLSGAVCATAACTTTVTPTQTVTIASRLELTIGPKED